MSLDAFPFLPFLAWLALAPAQESDLLDCLRPVRERILERIERGETPSIAVGVGKAGEVLWEEAFGLADRESGRRATTTTPYAIASLTKSITATGVMILVERGEIDLDAPVSRYLGEDALRIYEGDPDDLTLRRVLTHGGGIPHGWQSYPLDAETPSSKQCIADHAIVAFPPGHEFLYSNFAYGVPQVVIEAVSGKSYAAFLDEALFQPLGMTDGGPAVTKELAERAAVEYFGGGSPGDDGHFLPIGAAGAYASVRDLLRYGFFHLGALEPEKPIIGAETRRVMHATAKIDGQLGSIGFGTADLGNGLVWTLSNGRFEGVCSNISLIPSEGLVVVVLANTGTMLADELALEIANAFVPGLQEKVMAFIQKWEAEHAVPPWQPQPDWVGEWSGRIATSRGDVPFAMTFDDEGAIWLTWDDAHEARLENMRGDANRLTGTFSASLPNAEGYDGPQSIQLDLRRDGERVFGSAVASFEANGGSFSLPAYVGLIRD